MVNFKRDRRMFEEMRAAALTRLISRSPLGIAEKAHIAFDEKRSEFRFDSLGTSVQVNYPEFQVSGGINDWHELVILHYLEMADGTSLSRRWIMFGDLPQGFVRGGGFDQDCERLLGNILGNKPLQEIETICKRLGAEIISSRADFTTVFSVLPQYPIMVNLWFSDDEFAGTGKMLLDSNAWHYLTVEDAVTVGTLLLELLTEPFR